MSRRCPKQCITNDNFPTYKRDRHIGNSFSPCPFALETSELRSRTLLRNTIIDAGGPDVLTVDSSGNFTYNIDDEILTHFGFSRNSHLTVSGNREDDNSFGASNYIRYPTFSGSVYMSTTSHRGAYGYECSFNNCVYRQNNDGRRYFYL